MGNFGRPNQQRTTMERMVSRSEQSGPPQFLAVTDLSPNDKQPRRYFDDAELDALTESIRVKGVLQPLLVRKLEDGRHQIVAGERRWRAAQRAGLESVPVFIRHLSDEEAQEAALIENLERSDLNRFDEVSAKLELVALALGISSDETPQALRAIHADPDQRLEDFQNVTELLTRIGNRESLSSLVNNGLPVLNLSEILLSALRSGRIEYTKALVLNRAPAEQQEQLLQQAVQERWSIKDVRTQVQAVQKSPEKTRSRIDEVRAALTPKAYKQLPDSQRAKVDQYLEKILMLMAETS